MSAMGFFASSFAKASEDGSLRMTDEGLSVTTERARDC